MRNRNTVGNNDVQTNLESLRSEMISYCDQYLRDLKDRINREQELHERIQDDLSSEDRNDGWEAIDDAKKFLSVLLEKRMSVASAITPDDLRRNFNSFRRHISKTYKKLKPKESLFEEIWDVFSKHSSNGFKSS